MYKRIYLFIFKIIEKINTNSDVALLKMRQHLYFMDYEDRQSDIYLVSFLKSGTTWMQVILYNMLHSGDMNFKHIYDVSPWPQNEAFNGNSPDKLKDYPSPRIIKSHDKYNFFNNDCVNKFIFVYRDGKDVAVSLFHQNKNYNSPDITFNENFNNYFKDEKAKLNWFSFTKEWLENKNKFQILYVSYEDLKTNFDTTIHKIAAYLNVTLTEEISQRIKFHSSFEYMKAHETKFGEQPVEEQKLIYDQFIRNGNIGEGKKILSEEQSKFFQENFDLHIKPILQNRLQQSKAEA